MTKPQAFLGAVASAAPSFALVLCAPETPSWGFAALLAVVIAASAVPFTACLEALEVL